MVRRRSTLAAFAVLLLGALLWSLGPSADPARAADPLVGTFRLTAGSCNGGAKGSYFRMILPSGDTNGPWIDNDDSTCSDHTYTLFTPGTDGGLATGGYQTAPDPGFDGDGNSLANRIIRPVKFFGVNFALSTNPTDLQSGAKAPAPSISATGGKLTGDLSSFDATWNRQAFNQGSPKPGGGTPGLTKAVSGTYDAATGAYSLTWTSLIVDGPFDGFTGLWHLEGTFVQASAGGTATTVAPAAGGGSTATTVAGSAPVDGAPANPSGSKVVPASVSVTDDGFEAPVWAVLLLAGLGIAAVIVLLVLDRLGRPQGSQQLEGTAP